jgi:osmoprotectant transport system ATP-binding protein
MSTRAAVEFRSVFKSFGPGQPALSDISFRIEPGENLVLLGSSGSGKTTTLKMINRLVEPDRGQVLVEGREVREWDPIRLRRHAGYVIQEVGLLPHLRVWENVALVPRLEGWEASRRRERALELLTLVGLPPEEYAEKRPAQLSGGQKQRVGVARALAVDPPLLLMDEPFGALDPITRRRLQQEFLALEQRLGKTVVFVTHDVTEAFRLADRIAVFDGGRIRQIGTRQEILERPADDFVREFVRPDAP